MGCLIQIGGGVVGLILCIVVGSLLHTITGSEEIAILGGIVTFAVCIVKGFDYGSKVGEKKPEELFAPPSKTTRGNRKATHSKPLGKRVALQYINASGEHRKADVDSASASRNHNKVKVNLWNSPAKMELIFERIKNPEVLGLSKNPQNKDEVVSRDCPNCSNGNVRAWQGEMRCWNCGNVLKEDTPEPLPPVLTSPEPMPPTISAEPVVVLLQYLNRRGQEREIRVEAKAYMDGNSLVHCYLADSNGTLVLKQEQILNSSVLILRDISEMPTEDEEPPVLEPKVLELGDSSGPELIYTQNSGELAVIHFDPTTVEKVGNLVNLSPMGIDERYAIALGKIINPDVLENEPEPELEVEELPPVLPTLKPQPEVPEPQLPQGTRVLIRRMPTDSYEAVQVMRRIKPKLSTFDIFELLEQERLTALTGYDHDEAIRVGGELEAVGCAVDIVREGN